MSEFAREGRAAELPELEDTLLYLQVALFAGRDTAAGLGLGKSPHPWRRTPDEA